MNYSINMIEWYFVFLVFFIFIIICFLKIKKKIYFSEKNLYLFFSFVSLLFFIKILSDLLREGPIVYIDLSIAKNIIYLWQPVMTKLIILISFLLDIFIFLLLSFLLVYIIKNKSIKAFFMFFLIIIGFSSGILIKYLTKIMRPADSLISMYSYAFPSGHAIFSVLAFSSIIYFFANSMKTKLKKYFFIAINIFLILFFGFVRLFINVHTFSQVIAGYALGFFIFSLSVFFFSEKISCKKKQY